MRRPARAISGAVSVAVLFGSLGLVAANVPAADNSEAPKSAVEQGKEIAFDRKLGNCLACHAIVGGELAGNIGPPLVAMQGRFPDKAKLRAQIWDATVANPNSMMPPFGRHRILSEGQIDLVVEFIHTL